MPNVCEHFLRGRCSFGAQCRFIHPVGQGQGRGRGGGGRGQQQQSFGPKQLQGGFQHQQQQFPKQQGGFATSSNRAPTGRNPFGSVTIQPSVTPAAGRFHVLADLGAAPSTGFGAANAGVSSGGWGSGMGNNMGTNMGGGMGGFGGQQFAQTSQRKCLHEGTCEQVIQMDMEAQPLWLFSCYSHDAGDSGNLITGDISFEEMRWLAYQDLRATGNIQQYTQYFNTQAAAFQEKRTQLRRHPEMVRQSMPPAASGTSGFGAPSAGAMSGSTGMGMGMTGGMSGGGMGMSGGMPGGMGMSGGMGMGMGGGMSGGMGMGGGMGGGGSLQGVGALLQGLASPSPASMATAGVMNTLSPTRNPTPTAHPSSGLMPAAGSMLGGGGIPPPMSLGGVGTPNVPPKLASAGTTSAVVPSGDMSEQDMLLAFKAPQFVWGRIPEVEPPQGLR